MTRGFKQKNIGEPEKKVLHSIQSCQLKSEMSHEEKLNGGVFGSGVSGTLLTKQSP